MKVKAWLAAGVIAAGLAVAGCGSDDETAGPARPRPAVGRPGRSRSASRSTPPGPAGFTGVEGKKGIDLAVEEANASKALGDATLAVDVQDGASDPKQAASLMTSMVKDYPVVSQGMTSGGALAAAPIAQKAGVPIAIILAGAPGHRRDR